MASRPRSAQKRKLPGERRAGDRADRRSHIALERIPRGDVAGSRPRTRRHGLSVRVARAASIRPRRAAAVPSPPRSYAPSRPPSPNPGGRSEPRRTPRGRSGFLHRTRRRRRPRGAAALAGDRVHRRPFARGCRRGPRSHVRSRPAGANAPSSPRTATPARPWRSPRVSLRAELTTPAGTPSPRPSSAPAARSDPGGRPDAGHVRPCPSGTSRRGGTRRMPHEVDGHRIRSCGAHAWPDPTTDGVIGRPDALPAARLAPCG